MSGPSRSDRPDRPSFRLGELAARVGGRVVGDVDRRLSGVATLEDAGPDELSFLTNPRYRVEAERCGAGAILVPPGTALPGHDLLEVEAPYLALAEILEAFHPAGPRRPGVSPDARVAPDARLGEEVEIGPFVVVGSGARVGDRTTIGAGCVVGEGAEVGADSFLAPRVVLYPGTRVGERCILHSGVVLGADGFGFADAPGRRRKIPQVGRVVVEDDVEIGANSVVDRAAVGETVVGRGTKIDDLVMVAHGVRIGPDCLLVAQSGVAGSTRLGARVTIAGQSGAAGHLAIGDGSVVAAKSAVFEDVAPGSFVAGVPAVDHRSWKRQVIELKHLAELRREIRSLAERVARLASSGDGRDDG